MDLEDLDLANGPYPLAPHDANVGAVYCGACGISVFHLGGDLLEAPTRVISDMALAWLLGIEDCVGGVGTCGWLQSRWRYETSPPRVSHNILKVTDADSLRIVRRKPVTFITRIGAETKSFSCRSRIF
jgi:hypothetical protein